MIFFVLVLLLIIFSASHAEGKNKFNDAYIAKEPTNNIKGIFVILILFSHAKGYLTLDGSYDAPYIQMQNHLNQMVVAMFLFYSGYGIMEQIKKREYAYIQSLPKKRFPNLLLNYDISVVLFGILTLALGKPLTVKQVLLALVAWNGVGNSSWYIFVTLLLYVITGFSFFWIKWFNKKQHLFCYVVLLTVLNILLVYTLKHFRSAEPWWYNTAILYSLGFWYSHFKDRIEKMVMKSDVTYLCTLAVATFLYLYFYLHRWDSLLVYSVWGILFTLGITLITMKVKIESNLLKWFGEHIFSIYILQRIPMILLHEAGVSQRHKYVFVLVSIAVTCAMAEIFDIFTGKLSSLIWKPKQLKQSI